MRNFNGQLQIIGSDLKRYAHKSQSKFLLGFVFDYLKPTIRYNAMKKIKDNGI